MTTQTYDTGVIEIAPNAYAFIQPNGATNAGFIVGEEGIIVIDSLMTATMFSATNTSYRPPSSATKTAALNLLRSSTPT